MNELNLNGRFLHDLRKVPPPQFAEALRRRLQRQSFMAAQHRRRPLLRAASIGAVIVGISVLFAVPGVRAAAQQFLELFRVKNFVAIPLDRQRLDRLSKAIDLPRLLGEQSTLHAASPTEWFATPDAATYAAGFAIAVPQDLRSDMALTDIKLFGSETRTVKADVGKLQQWMNALEVRDLAVPPGLDGKELTLTMPKRVQLSYQSSRGKFEILQAPIPQFELPANVNLAVLGEIGLRMLGMSPSEAHTFAQAIDWRTTLLVPLPADVGSFQQVSVQGYRGLAIEMRRQVRPGARIIIAEWNMVLWTDDEFVHGLQGSLNTTDLLALANSMKATAAAK